ncbi:MAG: peptidoglycan DD-metalloendopeptidase family protein [Acidobacteriota bacterium]
MATQKKGKSLRFFGRLAVVALVFLFGLALYSVTERLESYCASPYPVSRTLRFDRDLIASPVWVARPDHDLSSIDLPLEFTFRRGQTLGDVVEGLGLEANEARALISEVERHVDVRRIRPSDRYAAMMDTTSELSGLKLTLDGKGYLLVKRHDAEWTGSWYPFIEEREIRRVRGSLEGALEVSIRRAGGEIVLAYEMADVLQWDLDFNRDLRLGDTFEVLYERVLIDGAFARVGEVLALVYVNNGRKLEAYRFGADGGHYDAEGRPLRKLFLRSPLRYSRVTSGFSSRRYHPVLKRYQPHYGVDYGAPTGTPVRVTGNGTVTFVGWNGGGGKTVKVRHPNGYLTAYLHLSRFASGVRSGRRVQQGDVVGFVGSTGLATGPHLDYRIQRDGRWINPLQLDNKPAEPVSPEEMPRFMEWRDELRRALETGQSVEPPV